LPGEVNIRPTSALRWHSATIHGNFKVGSIHIVKIKIPHLPALPMFLILPLLDPRSKLLHKSSSSFNIRLISALKWRTAIIYENFKVGSIHIVNIKIPHLPAPREDRLDFISFRKAISSSIQNMTSDLATKFFFSPVENDLPWSHEISRAIMFELDDSLQFIDAISERHFNYFSRILDDLLFVASEFILSINLLIGRHSMAIFCPISP
jgi:hypothetical protein